MKKKLLLILIVLLTSLTSVIAQVKVSGIVKDSDGNAIPGATVVQKGTTTGIVTDFDGKFALTVGSADAILQISFVGMKPVEVPLGGKSTVDVRLEADNVGLNEVVVTALGIQRDKKTLTYSSQQVSGDEILKSKDINFMNSLSGKTAGLEIKKSSSGAGGSTRTVLRGNKSLSGLSEPLYVIDGIPMVNHKGGQPGMWGGTDEGDGLSQINPEDIESISILKGSNAAVLYGSQGANGVVMINTKKGKEGKTSVNFSSSTTFESIMTSPELQYTYGSEGGAKESWSYTKGSYDDSFVKDFFQAGHNLVNTLSVSGGNDKTTAYFSYGNTSSKGIVPLNEYHKNNVTFKQATKFFNDKITVRSNVMLSSEKTHNRNAAGYYLNPLTGLYLFPRDKDFSTYKDNYQVFNASRNMYLQNWFVSDHMQSNPYWIINNEPKDDLAKRIIANAAIEYQITEALKFQIRGNYDYAVKTYEQKHYAGSNSVNVSSNGRWQYKKYDDESMYTDAILTYNKTFGDFSVSAMGGASYQKFTYGKGVSVDNGTNDLIFPNEFYFQNLPTNVQVYSTLDSREIKQGLFGNAQFGYKDMIYVDLSGRNDWASTLALTGNESYFYPSVGLTGILSNMLKMPTEISFAKVRASYSTVANEVPFNMIRPQGTIDANTGSINASTQAPFENLKPEMLRSFELGTEWRFFDGRLGFDFTYYSINSKDQFIQLEAPSGSGYTYYYVNAGEIVNKGIELLVDGTPISNANFSWKTTFNFAKNNSEIIELVPEFEDKIISLGSSEGYNAYVKAGGSFGDLYGYKFKRNEAGQIMLSETTGAPLKTSTVEYIGNLNPDWSLGWNNTMSYKNLSLSFLINAIVGGNVVSQTESILDGYGVSKRTADARDKGYVSINAIKGTTAVTEIDPKLYYTAVGDRNGILEPYCYDRTNIRLSQLSVSYDLDVNKLNIPIKAASISLVGQNLLFFYKEAPYDPELTMSTGLTSQSLDNFNLPSTRTYGFNVKLSF